jgi:hypothetical protein
MQNLPQNVQYCVRNSCNVSNLEALKTYMMGLRENDAKQLFRLIIHNLVSYAKHTKNIALGQAVAMICCRRPGEYNLDPVIDVVQSCLV